MTMKGAMRIEQWAYLTFIRRTDIQMSVTFDTSGLKLVGDAAAPGVSQYYGTDASGTKGFYAVPSGGSTGATGAPGSPGVDGHDGEDGWPGPQGAQGPAGTSGADGAAGLAGATAFLIPDPIEGEQGWPGAPGATGAAGSAGLNGSDGPATYLLALDGEEGMQGPPGVTGPAGASGANGADGAIGAALFFVAADDAPEPMMIPGPQGAAGSGATTWTEAEFDFGATPVYNAQFTLTDAAITSSAKKVLIVPSGNAPTGGQSDEWEMDSISFAALAGAGSATVYAHPEPGPVSGKRKVFYAVA
jgi:hypothetical protein